MTQSQYRIGFDVGGTFTDFVLQTPTGDLHTAKRLTTYPDPSAACLAGLADGLARAGCSWPQLGQAVHGTTIGSNLVIERKGRDVALITTRGFRDVLIIGRSKRYQVYDLQIEKPRPLIPRRLIAEVPERMLADGAVLEALDETEARRVIRALGARGVRTVAICLLHAYVNPAHERRLADLSAEGARRIRGAAVHHAVLGGHRHGRGHGALPGADDRVGAGGRHAHGGRLRRACGPAGPDRLRHGRNDGQARAPPRRAPPGGP